MMEQGRWVLVVPFLCFVVATQLFVRSENEARVLFSRAQNQWRLGNYEAAIEQFESLREKHPKSGYAADALWEIATIYYFNRYDISNALYNFEQLGKQYPEDDRAADSHLKAAEIFEIELNEISKAIAHWEAALRVGLSDDLRREVWFKLADASFKNDRFEEALQRFYLVVADGQDAHLVDQARLRIGSIFQLKGKHEKAAGFFLNVLLGEGPCVHCRLQAQLGLIETYEHLDRLPEAIEVAESIREEDYPAPMRDLLLARLSEKRKYYEPTLRVP